MLYSLAYLFHGLSALASGLPKVFSIIVTVALGPVIVCKNLEVVFVLLMNNELPVSDEYLSTRYCIQRVFRY